MEKLVQISGSYQVFVSTILYKKVLACLMLNNSFSHAFILFMVETGELDSYHCEHPYIYLPFCLLTYFRICGAQETLQRINKDYLHEVI